MRYNIFLILLLAIGISACEDPVDVDYPTGDTFFVVEAFLDNTATTQYIRLSQSKAVDVVGETPAVSNATVTVTNENGVVYPFTHIENGIYVSTASDIIALNTTYTLDISHEGTNYTGVSKTSPNVVTIDSISSEFFEAGGLGGPDEDGYFLELHAIDLPGQFDYYWIKSFNSEGEWLNEGSGQALVVDAGYTEDGSTDGFPFIPPVRGSINSDFDEPFLEGDSVYVEVHSITRDTWRFNEELVENADNGGFFAIPYYNPRCNITSSASDKPVIGWFSASVAATTTYVVAE